MAAGVPSAVAYSRVVQRRLQLHRITLSSGRGGATAIIRRPPHTTVPEREDRDEYSGGWHWSGHPRRVGGAVVGISKRGRARASTRGDTRRAERDSRAGRDQRGLSNESPGEQLLTRRIRALALGGTTE